MSQSGAELFPSLSINANRGHSRQASESNVNSNYSTTSINSTTNGNQSENSHLRLVIEIFH